MKILFLIAAWMAQDSDANARTRTVMYSENQIDIRLSAPQEGKNITTVVTFPEEALDSMVVPWQDSDLSLERHRNSLFLRLLHPVEGDLHVHGASGTLYRLRLRPVAAGQDYDGLVILSRPTQTPSPRTPAIELIRAMRLGEVPPDVTVRSASQPLFASQDLEVTLCYVYDSPLYLGYTLRLLNRTTSSFRLDPSRFASEDLVLAGTREMVLQAGQSTSLYLVFWK